MNLLFLGTSAGTPTKQRNFSGLALRERTGKGWYLIDCGEATQHQLLHTPLSLHGLRAILITHVHGDHCYGLPGLLASASMNGRTAPLTIVAPLGIQAWLETTFSATELELSFALEFVDASTLPQVAFEQVKVETSTLSHRVPCYAYTFTEINIAADLDTAKLERDGIPCGALWGQVKQGIDIEFAGKRLRSGDYLIQKHPPRKIVIAGDNDRPALLAQACTGAQVLVHEATYTQALAEKASEVGHSYASLVGEFAEAAGVPHLVLTHFSPRYQFHPQASPSIEEIRREAQSIYSGSLYLARDFLEFSLDKAGCLVAMTSE
ncbi:ribonuclease Z [Halomonas sp. HNIBRBA4712]|uniref:ribonuclease Z n=1 Tax=Halomonas sp. HNIBRBA4712 TaxID=3373087 RepID=UPI003744BD32